VRRDIEGIIRLRIKHACNWLKLII
jgi:hypothetical protein